MRSTSQAHDPRTIATTCSTIVPAAKNQPKACAGRRAPRGVGASGSAATSEDGVATTSSSSITSLLLMPAPPMAAGRRSPPALDAAQSDQQVKGNDEPPTAGQGRYADSARSLQTVGARSLGVARAKSQQGAGSGAA